MSISEAAGTTKRTVNIKGKAYILSVLSLKDFADIESTLKDDKLKGLKTIGEAAGLKGAEFIEYLESSLKKVNIFSILNELGTKNKKDITGDNIRVMLLLFYHSFQKEQPDLTFKDVTGFMDSSTINELSSEMGVIVGGESDAGKNAEGQTI